MSKVKSVEEIKRENALEAAKPVERDVEQCVYCGLVGEMNLHVLDGEDVKQTLTFHDSACYNAYEKEQGHIET